MTNLDPEPSPSTEGPGSGDRLGALIGELRERRVFAALVLYAGGAWVLTQIVGFFVGNYELSRRLLDVTVFLLVLGIPAAGVLAWFHGSRGVQRITRVEGGLLATILVIAAAGSFRIATAEDDLSRVPLELAAFGQNLAGKSRAAGTGEGAIAVMPFRSSLGEDSLVWLGRGVSELLSTNLAQLPEVRVVSGQRLFDLLRQEGVEESHTIPEGLATEIALRAGARFMLTGSILGRPQSLILSASLMNVETGEIAAAASGRGTAEDVFQLVDRISRDLSGQIREAPVAPTEMAPVAELTTGNLSAFKAFQAGLEAERRLYFREAADHFRRAVELDPEFALAHLHLASMSGRLAELGSMIEHLQLAREHLSEAASDKDRLVMEAMLAAFEGDRELAAEKLRAAIRLAPDDKWIRMGLYTMIESEPGGADSARLVLEEIIELDPLYAPAYNLLAYHHARRGRFVAADSLIRIYMDLDSGEANPWDSWGEILEAQGEHERARAAYREALRLRPAFDFPRQHLVRSYLRQGRPRDARN